MKKWDHNKGVLNRWEDPDVDLEKLVAEYWAWIVYYMACHDELCRRYGP